MPYLNLTTNVALDDPKAFCLEFSEFATKTLDKPKAFISLHILRFSRLNEGYSRVFLTSSSHTWAYRVIVDILPSMILVRRTSYIKASILFLSSVECQMYCHASCIYYAFV
ncbi:hypothetical protein AcV7_009347 [Taiwanofungus camphoratus]|nr:hypothetical protein AcV7_009347 [Antrodia cinnamomea]